MIRELAMFESGAFETVIGILFGKSNSNLLNQPSTSQPKVGERDLQSIPGSSH